MRLRLDRSIGAQPGQAHNSTHSAAQNSTTTRCSSSLPKIIVGPVLSFSRFSPGSRRPAAAGTAVRNIEGTVRSV